MLVFVVTMLIFLALTGVLLWAKNTYHVMTQADVIKLLQNVLVGQASENEWAIFLSTSFRRYPALESIRAACAEIDEKEYLGHSPSGHLLSKEGLAQLQRVLKQVEALDLT